jgi:hypothetical protein
MGGSETNALLHFTAVCVKESSVCLNKKNIKYCTFSAILSIRQAIKTKQKKNDWNIR